MTEKESRHQDAVEIDSQTKKNPTTTNSLDFKACSIFLSEALALGSATQMRRDHSEETACYCSRRGGGGGPVTMYM